MVGVEIVGVPFEGRVGRLLLVAGRVIHADGQDVFLVAEVDQLGDVDAKGGHAILEEAGRLTVDKEMGSLFQALKLDENLAARGGGGELEMLAIPCDARPCAVVAAAMADDLIIGIDIVIGVGEADRGPL